MKDKTLQFYCSHCKAGFKRFVWSLDRAYERTEFTQPLPEVVISDSSSVAPFCSEACLKAGIPELMAQEKVPIPIAPPDIGPIEQCAVCGSLVDMTRPHLAYSTSACKQVSMMVMEGLEYHALAVVCSTCRPVSGAAAYDEPTTTQ